MSTPDGDRESTVRRLRGSQRTVAVVLLVVSIAGVGIVAAQTSGDTANVIQNPGFENGSDNWNDYGVGPWTISNSVSHTGERSLHHDAGGSIATVRAGQEVAEDEYTEASVWVKGTVFSGQGLELEHGGSGNYVTEIGFWNSGIDVPGVGVRLEDSFASDDTWRKVRVHNIDYSNNEYDVSVYNESLVELGTVTNAPFEMDADGIDAYKLDSWDENTNIYFDDAYLSTQTPIEHIGEYELSGTVTDQNGNELPNVSIEASQNGSVVNTAETDQFGQYQMVVPNGTVSATASKGGYFPQTETVEVSGEDITQDFTLTNRSAALTIDTRPFLEHGESAAYSVTFTNTSKTGNENRTEVTTDATVTSGDMNVLTVNSAEQEIVATSDTSVNNRTYVQAEYTTGGETYTTQYNVTVANETVNNLDILPPVERFTASLSGGTDANPNDRTILLLIIGAAVGAAASIIATSFAGVAALTMVMMLGWILGATSNGMAMVTVFIALFVGLNVAGNVDYTVRK